jgi:hypothetical protein
VRADDLIGAAGVVDPVDPEGGFEVFGADGFRCPVDFSLVSRRDSFPLSAPGREGGADAEEKFLPAEPTEGGAAVRGRVTTTRVQPGWREDAAEPPGDGRRGGRQDNEANQTLLRMPQIPMNGFHKRPALPERFRRRWIGKRVGRTFEVTASN